MRNDVKEYYQSLFGSFLPISAKEINKLNIDELHVLELPRLFYNKEKSIEPELKIKLQKRLAINKN